MKNKWTRNINQALVFSVFLISTQAESFAIENIKKQQDDSALLIQQAEDGDIHAVQILGESQDVSLIPIFSDQLIEARRANASPVYIRILRRSLAGLGNSVERKEIIEELESSNRYVQYHAIEDAGRIGGNDMVNVLAKLLNDPSPGGRPIDKDGTLIEDVGLPAPRHSAVIALTRIIDDPTAPAIDLKRITYSEKSVKEWQSWWLANQDKYMEDQ